MSTETGLPTAPVEPMVMPLSLVPMNTGIGVRDGKHRCIARLKYDERCEDRETRHAITREVFEMIGTANGWLPRLAELLGCDEQWRSVSVAIQELQSQQDTMRRTIGELRGRLSIEA